MQKSAKAAFNAQLAEWRVSHFEEMEANLRAWINIREDSKCSAKDRNEAAKNIARALGGLAAERPPASLPHPSGSPDKEDGLPISKEEMASLDENLAKFYASH